MFAYEQIIYQPAFYFLLAFTIVLTLGYSWGRRWNRRVLVNALDPLLDVFKAQDQRFTNIGGQTGFHATIIPGNIRTVRAVDITITLLPRQSWLYLPFSLLVRRFDRMQVAFEFNKRGKRIREEAHLVEERFSKTMGNSIEHADSLNREELSWGGRTFLLYSSSEMSRAWMQRLMGDLGEPGTVRHAAIVPERERAYLFIIPKPGTVPETCGTVARWLDAIHLAGDEATPSADAIEE